MSAAEDPVRAVAEVLLRLYGMSATHVEWLDFADDADEVLAALRATGQLVEGETKR